MAANASNKLLKQNNLLNKWMIPLIWVKATFPFFVKHRNSRFAILFVVLWWEVVVHFCPISGTLANILSLEIFSDKNFNIWTTHQNNYNQKTLSDVIVYRFAMLHVSECEAWSEWEERHVNLPNLLPVPGLDLCPYPKLFLPPSTSIMVSHLNHLFTFNMLKMALRDLSVLFSVVHFVVFLNNILI